MLYCALPSLPTSCWPATAPTLAWACAASTATAKASNSATGENKRIGRTERGMVAVLCQLLWRVFWWPANPGAAPSSSWRYIVRRPLACQERNQKNYWHKGQVSSIHCTEDHSRKDSPP